MKLLSNGRITGSLYPPPATVNVAVLLPCKAGVGEFWNGTRAGSICVCQCAGGSQGSKAIFNSPWYCCREVLRYHNVLRSMQVVIGVCNGFWAASALTPDFSVRAQFVVFLKELSTHRAVPGIQHLSGGVLKLGFCLTADIAKNHSSPKQE